ncbi:hypothetical protein ASG06_14345 [Rathayibacter sp. Leaf185]|nr:hypothetical protein ASF42_14345 [Rathayibacter sp. Leaf294]KQS10735.1 hypothetical protein ASG06_14345 [Rathayibacter sp. Leaf185]
MRFTQCRMPESFKQDALRRAVEYTDQRSRCSNRAAPCKLLAINGKSLEAEMSPDVSSPGFVLHVIHVRDRAACK